MFIPITIVKKVLDALIVYIKTDYEMALQNNTEEESFLYRVLYGNKLGDFDFYTEAVDIFTRTDASSRQIQIRMGFDLSQVSLPTVYVHQPSEPMKGVNTIGFGEDTNEFYQNSDGTQTDKLFRGFGSTFEYVCISPNILETLLIYEVLHAALISAIDTFTENFNLVTFTGKEYIAKNDSMPNPLFLKTIILDVDYIKQVPRLVTCELVQFVEFEKAKIYGTEAIGSNLV